MATTSTVPAAIDGLIALLTPALGDVPIFEAWPGTEGKREMVFLGEVEWADYRIATIKAGRKHRQEDLDIGFEVWVFGVAGTTPANPKEARDRAFAILSVIEDALAVDVTAGTNFATVQYAQLRLDEAGPRLHERGWAYRIAGAVGYSARLL